eukprot:Em0093g8a
MQYSGSNRDVPAIKWGIEHEQEARSMSIQLDFECALGNHFWLQPQMVSFLAAVVVKVCWRSNALSSIGIVNQPV